MAAKSVCLRREPQIKWLLFGVFEPRRAIFSRAGEFAKLLNTFVGECQNAVVADSIYPDAAVLDFHFDGNFVQPIFIHGKVLGHTVDGGDVVNLVDVHT